MTKQQISKIAKTLYKAFQSIFQDDGIDSCSWDIDHFENRINVCINDRQFEITIIEKSIPMTTEPS